MLQTAPIATQQVVAQAPTLVSAVRLDLHAQLARYLLGFYFPKRLV